jgi:putative transposase
MKAMSSKGFGNGKAAMDNGNGMFLTMLAYKLAVRGKQLVKVDKWYASSQICSNCGENTGKKSLEIREWDCPFCHVHHDRDINAAINIKNEGLRLLGAV